MRTVTTVASAEAMLTSAVNRVPWASDSPRPAPTVSAIRSHSPGGCAVPAGTDQY